jgi:hypothetical protein
MSTNEEHSTDLPDEVTELLSLGSDGSEEAISRLRSLPDKFTSTSHTKSVQEALQLLGTAVGKQSRRVVSFSKD